LLKRATFPGFPARHRLVLVVCAIAFVACARQDEKPAANTAPAAAPAPSGPHADFIPTQAQLDSFIAEGPDPTLRKISAVDYYLHYRLMQATGIEKELGGEEKAIAALKALGEEYERRMRAMQVELPRMIKTTAFTGEGMSSGFMGMGMGSFLGFIGSGLGTAVAGNLSDAELVELNKKGGIKHEHDSGSAQFTFDKDGSMTQSIEFEVKENGLNGKVKMKTRMSACPDADGKVTVDIDVDSQMSASGKPGTGGYVHSTMKYERYLDDDAHLIDTADGGAFNNHIKMGGFENFQSQSFEVTTGRERGGKQIFVENAASGYSIFRKDEIEKAFGLIQAADFLQTIVAESMLRGLATSTGSPWESGRCIDLKVTSDPGKRKGIRPSTAFDLEAIPRVKSDASAAGGTVTATLNGGSSLQPASGKVKADAKYGYTGPEKKNETASIDFESRSKRGVGKASLAFDTKLGRPYRMEGGAGDFHGVGTACDLEQPFTVAGGGNTVSFVPSSRDGGTYTYAGSMAGFGVHGYGTYTVKYADDVAVSIVAKGPGTVETPIGPQTGEGTENYTLTPLGEGEECK
jgi:hypothetical protein